MKYRYIFIFIVFITAFELPRSFCQESYFNREVKFILKNNQFDGDRLDYNSFLLKNIKFPVKAMMDKMSGVGVIQFMIDENGDTYNHDIVDGTYEIFGEELIRLSKLMPLKPDGKGQVFEWTVPFEQSGYDKASILNELQSKLDRFMKKERYRKALPILENMIRIDPYQLDYLYSLARTYIALNKIDDACKVNFRLEQLGMLPLKEITCNVDKN